MVWEHAHHVEHLRNGRDGVEQSWSFASRPTGRGDLVVRIAAEGLPFVGATQGGLHFADASGVGVRYGHALWVAADGARTPVPATWRGDTIELRVPAGVVDASVYPAVLDPVIGPEVGVDEAPFLPGGRTQSAAVATNGTDYLVTWVNAVGAVVSDVHAARVDASGALLDRGGLLVATGQVGAFATALASNGADYLVAWGTNPGPSEIRVARVTGTGTVHEATTVVESGGRYPALASASSEYLLTWADSGDPTQGVLGMRLGADAAVLGAGAFPVSPSMTNTGPPTVASNGAGYLVAWGAYTGETADVLAARVSSAGVLEDAEALVVSATGNHRGSPALASNGSDYLVVWEERAPDADFQVRAARISAAGVVEDAEGLAISPDGEQASAATAAGLDSDYVVVWRGPDAFVTPLYGARVTSAGAVERATAAIHPGHYGLALACHATGCLLICCASDVYATRLTSAISVVATDEVLVSAVARVQEAPAIASDGEHYLLVWADHFGGQRWSIQGVRVAADGALLDPVGRVIAYAQHPVRAPAVASNGDAYLVVWEQDSSDSGANIMRAMVPAGADPFEPGSFVLSSAPNDQVLPDVASDGSQFLVVWQDHRSPSSVDIYGARVTHDNLLQDGAGFPIGSGESDEGAPAIASNGVDYLVVWAAGSAGAQRDLHAALLAWQTPTVIRSVLVSAAATDESSPAVASDGVDYLAVWEDAGSGAGHRIRGARMSAAGAVRDDPGFVIRELAGDALAPALAFDGRDYLVVWQERPSGGTWDIRGALVSRRGVLRAPAEGLTLSAGSADEEHPAVASGRRGEAMVAYQRPEETVPQVYARRHVTNAEGGGCHVSLRRSNGGRSPLGGAWLLVAALVVARRRWR